LGKLPSRFSRDEKTRVTLRDISRSLEEAEVRIYFVGRKPDGELFIYNDMILTIPLHSDLEASDEIAAPSLFSNEQRYVRLGTHYSSGAHMEGWIAIGRDGSHVFGQAASNQNLLKTAQDGSLDQLIAKAGIHDRKPASVSRHRTKRAKAASPQNLPAVRPAAPQIPCC
jgi:hypothetical protein